jgi:NAD(P)-dependent dehydrogenase (short-subunit alcohol dehydrogenase family)
VYKAAKAGLDHLTKSLATDFAHKGIPVRVNLIAPGLFASERSGDDESAKKRTAEGEPWYLVSYPLKRAGKYVYYFLIHVGAI